MTTSALSQSGWPARSFSSINSLSSAAVFRGLSGIIMTIQTGRTPCLGNAARTIHYGPNQKHYHGPNRRSDETRTLIGSIPAERLSQVSGNERADDAQNRREDEALRLIASRGDELGKDPRNKADKNCP